MEKGSVVNGYGELELKSMEKPDLTFLRTCHHSPREGNAELRLQSKTAPTAYRRGTPAADVVSRGASSTIL